MHPACVAYGMLRDRAEATTSRRSHPMACGYTDRLYSWFTVPGASITSTDADYSKSHPCTRPALVSTMFSPPSCFHRL